LTQGQSNDVSPVWSPDGNRLAYVKTTDDSSACVVFSVSSPGDRKEYPGCAAPGEGTEPLPALAWTQDGRSLVTVQVTETQPPSLAVLSLDKGTFQTITHPPSGTEGDSMPAVSPDGKTIVFTRGTTNGGADLYLCDLAGAAARRLTFDDKPILSAAWTRDGQDILYAANRVGPANLWRVQSYGGSPREFLLAGKGPRYVAIAPNGGDLVYTVSPTVSSIWRASLGGAAASEHAVIRTNGRETCPRYSPDGKKIADVSDQTGSDEIWFCDLDGSNRVQATHFNGPNLARVRWSRDSKFLIFDVQSDHGTDLYTMPADPNGKVARVTFDALNGSFSNDGKSVYFQSRNHIFKSGLDGGSPQQIGERGGSAQPVETLDGEYIYYRNRRTFWRIPAKGGEEEEAFIPEHDLMWSTTIQMTPKGMYFLEFSRNNRQMVVSFYDFETKKSDIVFRMKENDNVGPEASYSISPDGKTILYARVDQSQTNFVVVENFR
jgi:Tol biopolymer transport system component